MKKIIYGALAMLVLASCNKNEEITVAGSNYPSDGVVRISTTVNDLKTRSGATPYTGNTLSVSLDYGVGDQYTQSNIEWASEDNGATWEPSKQMLWKNATTAAKVYAFAPFIEGDDLTTVPFTVQQDQSTSIESSDLLGYVNNSFVPSSSLTTKNELNIDLSHKLSKLTLNITFGGQFETAPAIKSVSTNSVQSTVSYNATTGVATASGSTTSIKMHSLSATSYEVIFPAQTISANTKMLTVVLTNGEMYNYTVPASGHTFVDGAAYTMNLKVGKEKIELENVTVADWNTGDEIPGGEAAKGKAQIGFYYFEDGTYGSDPSAGKPIGIVYYVNPDGKTGKIVGLTQATENKKWGVGSINETVDGINSTTDGATATKNMITAHKDDPNFATDYPAFEWVYTTANGGDINGRWYIPAYEELKALCGKYNGLENVDDSVKTAVNISLSSISGATLLSKNYWSSTQSNSNAAGYVDFNYNGGAGTYLKDFPNWVRVVSTF